MQLYDAYLEMAMPYAALSSDHSIDACPESF